MVVELSRVEDLDIDDEYLDFVAEAYCANCAHCTTRGEESPFCARWEDTTEIKSGWVCAEYRPKGYPAPD